MTRIAAAALVIAGVSFLALELTVRVYLFGAAGLSPSRVNSIRMGGFGYLDPHPELGWEIRPSVSGLSQLVHFESNSAGMRDREYTRRKPAGTFRVAVVGSSFSLGPGVEITDTYHSRLERRYSRELAPMSVEFLNFSVGAYGAPQILTMLERRALAYRPDLLLVSTTWLSLPGLLGPALNRAPPLQIPAHSYPFLRSFLLKVALARQGEVERLGLAWTELGGLERAYMALMGESPEAPAAAKSATRPARRIARKKWSVLRTLVQVAETRGIPVVVAHLEIDPNRKTPALDSVGEQIRSAGLHFVDTRPAFEGLRQQDFWIYPLNPHPNAAAHDIFADVIAEFLVSNQLLPPGDRNGLQEG